MAQSIEDARRRQQGASASRVPPHNLQAEESLLGAMLLSRDAIVSAVEVQLSADDFYKPAHGHIFDAITSLYAQGDPADPVTVAESLSRAGVLEAIGGPAILVSLQAGTPSIGNAGRYARIIEEHSLLRRLIRVAGDIAEMGYSVPEDVANAVDEAEAMVFDVAQRRVTDSMANIRDLLSAQLDHLEALFERNQEITGVPTGFIDLDRQLAGLQPSNLVIIGGRPGTGKALALDTPIPTPAGWTTMGNLQPGDQVFDAAGTPCEVTYATPVMHGRQCYEVLFDDGSSIVADAEHQWFAYDFPAWKSFREAQYRTARPRTHPQFARDQSALRRWPRVVTTRQMIDEGVHACRDRRPNWYIPLARPLDLPDAELPVDPYVLGCWLGDGKTTGSEITIGAADEDHFRSEFTAAGYGFERRAALQWATVPVAGKGAWQGYAGPLRTLTRELRSTGLLRGARKHIPAPYLRASTGQRLALLQGLLDTDGHVEASGVVDLCLSSLPLLRQARELVCSLGHKPGPIRERSIRLPDGRVAKAWRFGWTPFDPVFRLRRKAQRSAAAGNRRTSGRITRRAIVSIRPVASVPVRCITVDSPDRLYLAGESMVPTHNTSFALGIAANAALEARTPTLVFSLEMSHRELTQRMLCSEARVDATRMRNGKLLESDWPKIGHAVGRLGEAPIFIDDNPHLTVMEIRAKARRLKSREGLGLIIIDYMQLMSGRHNAENRQVEVSEMSRGLKILARELNVPVIALSQLSRNLESRADKRPVLADLRESGCMPASTRLLRADNGQDVSLGELVLSQERPLVWSLDERQRLVPAELVNAFPSGIKPVFKLQLASGRSVDATANHPFLTVNGWTRLDALKPGAFVAVPRRLPAPLQPVDGWSDDELVLLAHMIGAGSMGSGFKYTTADPANLQLVQDLALRLFGIEARAERIGNTWNVWFPSPYRLTHDTHHPMRNWLEPHGLWMARAWTKFVPAPVFGLSDDQVARFLHHLWATDGSITIARNGRGELVRTSYATTSRRLALDVQRLLLRLGIRTTIGPSRKQRTGRPDEGLQYYRQGYSVRIQGAANQTLFLRRVGCHGQPGECVPQALGILEGIKDNPNLDLVPWEVAARVRDAAGKASVSHRQIASALGERYCGSYMLGTEERHRRFSRDRLARIAAMVNSQELSTIATSDVFWDEVIEVTPLGMQPTFDATVAGTHNFVADGIIAHNSLEQDADVVIFLYRDEVYNRDTPDRGTAEVIVAKHRNGPIGVTHLAFLDHYTRFANMARV
jgi:replicative DNA helicase